MKKLTFLKENSTVGFCAEMMSSIMSTLLSLFALFAAEIIIPSTAIDDDPFLSPTTSSHSPKNFAALSTKESTFTNQPDPVEQSLTLSPATTYGSINTPLHNPIELGIGPLQIIHCSS